MDLELERKGPIRRIFHTHNLAQTTFLVSFLPAKDCSLCGIWSVSLFYLQPYLPSRGSLIIRQMFPSPASPPRSCAHHSSMLSFYCPLDVLNTLLHQGVGTCPSLCPLRLPLQSPVAPFSLPSCLCSNVTSWERPLLTTPSKIASHPLPSSSPNPVPLFFKADAMILYTSICLLFISLTRLGATWDRNFVHYDSPAPRIVIGIL